VIDSNFGSSIECELEETASFFLLFHLVNICFIPECDLCLVKSKALNEVVFDVV
jgi:hypothetical protein